ncbi:NADH-quinone oxidoreductase subunit J [Rhodospirillum rubrum]|uniref:NADH-quinone oxidoreductase subunit J n=1 Tax=Rhodospirillum rubrum (strain ATCC 11170 / ATH 1.1.1 / DSM 467 / LMG 4362 / NCIMB 8255 / S1) TaxID=269796 RepID=Q2RU31_RHORT|nr:NADH-quinone oxidoreductase subunit J [Rhodospirillum rubrum]ABC22364.1 NADH-ubiquinone/plastoquinone oxidoreductase, chain 6 [Rhodospirillum rubrum ATCC 11170]AEO48081.1 NADH-ubiquinone/plastoquinone oxidoreductase, chain 6 [Rhodospirillum rubrum F11]MBK1663316.1 NADH:ubiquinone oxidoreductase subunit J [Rhodospirillum rubrum]MBK1675127.1 NADH:ubiquinone oxidoreductase subunit J [Rhodospirillum rubrum]MBK5953944.1 NADH:ubiquinone oxidoreductase subunit J [Rhodospirillum rubrum]
MIIQALIFYMLAAIMVASAFMVVISRNPVHSVLWLILTFVNSAGLFLLMGAEFVAMVVVVVYVGAVAVLFLFVVMMLDINYLRLREGFLSYMPLGAAMGVVLLAEIAVLAGGWAMAPDAMGLRRVPMVDPAALTNTQAIGQVLYTDYIYLFQAAGLVLLVAMIGSIMLTHRANPLVKRQNVADQIARRKERTLKLNKVPTGRGIS